MSREQGNLVPIEDRTYSFALELVRAFRGLGSRDEASRIIWHQLLKSGTSAGANSAEGPGAQSRPDWLTRRHIALKEMRETLFWLRLLRDASLAAPEKLAPLIDEADQLVAILTTIVKHSGRNPRAGK